MRISKIKWQTAYNLNHGLFGIQGEMKMPDGAIRGSRLWLKPRDLRMRGRIAQALRRIQRALIKDLEGRKEDSK